MSRVDQSGHPAQPITLPSLSIRPLVSVLIANFNYAGYVGHAIESVLAQSYSHLEVVVCDDGSSDGSTEVIRAIAQRDHRVKLIAKETNGGMAAATNAAFAESSGDIICLLDSDDYYHPEKLEMVVERLREEPRTGLLLHPLLVVDSDGQEVQQIPYLSEFERGWIAQRFIRRGGRWRDMPTTALCIRREAAAFVFPIPEADFRRAADGFTFTLLPLLTEVSSIDRPLAMYRVHGSNDHLALGFNEEAMQSSLRFLEVQNRTVNDRLEQIFGTPGMLRIDRHLGYQEQVFLTRLLGSSSRRDVLRAYARFFRMLLTDDLYRPGHKFLIGTAFGVAAILPGSLGKRWLGLAIGHNRFKQAIRAGMSRVRGVLALFGTDQRSSRHDISPESRQPQSSHGTTAHLNEREQNADEWDPSSAGAAHSRDSGA